MKTITGVILFAALEGCASGPGALNAAHADRYQCEGDLAFMVRFKDDSAAIDGNRGYEVLLRTAGGLTPTQTVFINRRMRAEFGLGASGREAILRYPLQPLVVRCVRDLTLDATK